MMNNFLFLPFKDQFIHAVGDWMLRNVRGWRQVGDLHAKSRKSDADLCLVMKMGLWGLGLAWFLSYAPQKSKRVAVFVEHMMKK